jgi:hypothetical protein
MLACEKTFAAGSRGRVDQNAESLDARALGMYAAIANCQRREKKKHILELAGHENGACEIDVGV